MDPFDQSATTSIANNTAAPVSASTPSTPQTPASQTPAPVSASPSPEQTGVQGTTVSDADRYAAQLAAQSGQVSQTVAANTPGLTQQAAAQQQVATQQAQTQAAAQQGFDSVRAYMAAMGDATAMQYQTDAQYMQAQAHERAMMQQQLATMQQLLAQQLQQQQPVTPAQVQQPQAPGYNPPEWNPALEQFLAVDPATGRVTGVRPGADPSIYSKWVAHNEYKQNFAKKFLDNPGEAIKPFVESMFEKMVRENVQQAFGGYQQTQQAHAFIDQNRSWLFDKDSAGNVVVNPANGKPIVSPAGNMFYRELVAAEKAGVPQHFAQEYALEKVRGAFMAYQLQQATGQAQQNQQFLQQHNRVPNAGGSTIGMTGDNGNVNLPQNSSLSLKEQLTQALLANGITDAHIASTM